MATLIAIVSDTPEPQQGEQVCLIRMSAEDGKGYRLSAVAPPSNRNIGRWISDCPLTVVQSALLWLTTQTWQIQSAPDSLDVNRVLDTVPRPTPASIPGIHPRDVVEILMRNLPPKLPTNPAPDRQARSDGPRSAPAPDPDAQPGPRRPAPPTWRTVLRRRGPEP